MLFIRPLLNHANLVQRITNLNEINLTGYKFYTCLQEFSKTGYFATRVNDQNIILINNIK